MRSEKEMFSLFDRIASEDDRIRVMTLEGSRVNPHVSPDIWQDYDITFLVTETDSFKRSDEWLGIFGDLVFMQKPEAMSLYPPGIPDGWFSYLMLFRDGIKIDLTLIDISCAEEYFASDPLIRVLVDKDRIAPKLPDPSDNIFRVACPPEIHVWDCANEFYCCSTYVQKALFRAELQTVRQHFEDLIHPELLRMLSWLAGARNGFPINTGKYHRWLYRYLTDDEQTMLAAAYGTGDLASGENAFENALDLFEKALSEVCERLGYRNPGYHDAVTGYMNALKDEFQI